MIEELEIVAGNGVPGLTVGYLIPVVRLEDRCFKLGESIDNGFDISELDDCAKSGMVTKIDPTIILAEIIPDYEPKTRKNRKQRFLSCEACLFYRDGPQMGKLRIPTKHDVPAHVRKVYFPLEYGHFEVFVIDNTNARNLFQDTFDAAETRLCSLLKKHDLFVADVDQIAAVLYQAAFDKESARKAIAYRGITVKQTINQNHYHEWAASAAKPWGLGKSERYWNRQVKELGKSLNA